MKTQIEKPTKVQFLIHPSDETKEVFAFFPKEQYFAKGQRGYNQTFTCYAHIGQHSACHIDYAKGSKPATKEEYKSLKLELEGLGYVLDIIEPKIKPIRITNKDIKEGVMLHARKELKQRFKKLDIINLIEGSVKFLENMTTEQFSIGADKVVREDLKRAVELLKLL